MACFCPLNCIKNASQPIQWTQFVIVEPEPKYNLVSKGESMNKLVRIHVHIHISVCHLTKNPLNVGAENIIEFVQISKRNQKFDLHLSWVTWLAALGISLSVLSLYFAPLHPSKLIAFRNSAQSSDRLDQIVACPSIYTYAHIWEQYQLETETRQKEMGSDWGFSSV